MQVNKITSLQVTSLQVYNFTSLQIYKLQVYKSKAYKLQTYPDDSFDILDQKFVFPDQKKWKGKTENDFDAFWQKAIHNPNLK